MEGKKDNGKDERWGGKAITCTRETEGGETDMKGREDLDDRSHYYVHYNGDGGGCEKKGDRELKKNSFKRCMKDIVTIITGTFRHVQGFISTRDT